MANPQAATTSQGAPTYNPLNITARALEQNRVTLNTIYRFKTDSKLKTYLAEKTGTTERESRSLADILSDLKHIIIREKMFDIRNPYVILCTKELEQAINQRALHVAEIRDAVLSQMETTNQPHQPQLQASPANTTQPAAPQPRRANVTAITTANLNYRYKLKPAFREIVRSTNQNYQRREIFTLLEISKALSQYILARKEKFFDSRNPRLALVENDPLGAALNLAAFHRSQMSSLIRSQLLPLVTPYNTNPKAAEE